MEWSRFQLVVWLLAFLLVSGCIPHQATADLEDLKAQLRTSETNIAMLQARLTELSVSEYVCSNLLHRTERNVWKLQYQYTRLDENKEIGLDFSKDGFQSLTTPSLIPLMVRCVSATPYLDGYTLVLDVANLASITVSQADLNWKWREDDDLASPAKSKKQHYLDKLQAAYATRITVQLLPLSMAELKQLRLSITPTEFEFPTIQKKM